MTPLYAIQPFGFSIPLPVIVLGAIVGMTYGLLAVGLVLVYRTNRIINFAHGEVGAFGAAVFGTAVIKWHVPYYLALPIAFAAAGGIAALAEVAVVRRLRNAPRIMSIVATLGVGQFLVFFSLAFNPTASAGFKYPSPPGLPEFNLGALRLTQAYMGMLIFGPIVVIALAVFLRRSRFGLGIRAASANPEAARMAGIFAGRMSSLAWALAGIVSAFTAILVLPSKGFTAGESFGPSLLLRAMAGAVIARMTSLPAALAAGVGIGVVEQLLLWNYPRSGLVEVALFVVIVVALLLQRGVGGREEEKGSWAAVQGWRPLPEAIARLREVRILPWVVAGVSLAIGVFLPVVISNANAVILTSIMGFAIIGMSVGVITGLGGQLSLGQFAIGAIGAVVSYQVSKRIGAFPLAFFYAGLGAAAVSLLIGLPALRIRGLLLTVSTLGFALVTAAWVLQQPWALGDGVDPGRPIVFGKALETGRAYYYWVLAVLVIVGILARNVRRGGLGRLLVAVRDNEDNARAFTVPARLVKLQGFLLAGFIAGIGGAAYGHMLSRIGTSSYPVGSSIDVVAMAVIGGMSLLAGPLIGAFYIIGIPAFLPLDSAGFAAQKLGWLLLILYLPGGIAQGLEPLRKRYMRWVARRHGIDFAEAEETASAGQTEGAVDTARGLPSAAAPAVRLRPSGSVLLEGVELSKRFGGVAAVDGVSIEVRAGEIVGLIGPNGAGKTTTFELLGGFTRPDRGRVLFDGEDVSDLGPEDRGKRGLIRSFQDAALFPTMTVLDAARLSFERVAPTSFFKSVLGLNGAERDKDRLARELVGAMGLDSYRNKQIQELSTGTRRITEIACLLALRPSMLLLDEPSSGIAQRETEALGRLLKDIKEQLDLTLLVIEHDIPLIMGLSDRIVAMDAGRVIAAGRPDEVRTNPLVVEAYLGGTVAAIERSDTRPAPRTGNGAAKTSRRKEPV
ncbi:MAG TPA: ATP-binding cassette domain-containing protein [Acidimicrobiales bacterium]|nr:ATP-binding cassette domain-containing protein [Acidimicrobiales bacterium]